MARLLRNLFRDVAQQLGKNGGAGSVWIRALMEGDKGTATTATATSTATSSRPSPPREPAPTPQTTWKVGYCTERLAAYRVKIGDKTGKRDWCTVKPFVPHGANPTDCMVARWPDGHTASPANFLVLDWQKLQRGPSKGSLGFTTSGKEVTIRYQVDRRAIWCIFVDGAQKCAVFEDLFLTASLAERFMMEMGYKLMADEVSVKDLYELRDTELRRLGLGCSAKVCMKRPASSQPTKDATRDDKNPKNKEGSKTAKNDKNDTMDMADGFKNLKDKASSSHEKRGRKEPRRIQPPSTRPS